MVYIAYRVAHSEVLTTTFAFAFRLKLASLRVGNACALQSLPSFFSVLLGLLLEPAIRALIEMLLKWLPTKELEKSGNIREKYLKTREI